ncbi:MAG TPA: DUF1622 domain-containing protein [Anaerolineae bacterium]|nr:DUF1622 domain-containing protein [Anaerolineae bacterium]
MQFLEHVIELVVGYTVPVIEILGGLVILIGVVRTVAQLVRTAFRLEPEQVTAARLQLAESLILGLEFQVAADVLKTALTPTWTVIGQLAALIALRSVLAFLLERELKELHEYCQSRGREG